MSNAMLQRYGPGGASGARVPAPALQISAVTSSTGGVSNPIISVGSADSGRSAAVSASAVRRPSSVVQVQRQQSSSSSIIQSTSVGYTTALKRSSPAVAAAVTSNSKTSNSNEQRQQSNTTQQQKSLAHALLPDLPLLMHGSGDVLPENVHPHSVAALAKLIEKYVSSLVSAALDAHDVFTDGEVVGGGACLGPPPFNATTEGDDDDDDNDSTTNKKRKASSTTSSKSSIKKKKKQKIDYWDVPLPPPGTNNNDDTNSTNNDSDSSDDDSDDDDAPLLGNFRRMSSSVSSSSFTSLAGGNNSSSKVDGIAPIDLHANERTRKYFVSAPTVMDARSFIFPICHDAVLYQRIKEVQASRRAIRRDVVDGTLMEVMKEEGALIGRYGMVDMFDAVLANDVNKSEGNDNAAGSAASMSLHGDKKKSGVVVASSKANDRDKKKGGDHKKKDGEKKNDGTNIVAAGLLDADDVDPSWPGLNSLLRGKLW